MNKKIALVITSIALVAILSACSGTTAASGVQGPPAIMVTGNGLVTIVPDIAYINIGVHSEAQEVAEALEMNNGQAQAIASALGELGVDSKDIQTTAFNVYPMQEYGPMGEIVNTKYAVDNVVYVTVRDLSNLGSMLDAVVKAGANTINSISFDTQNKEAAYAEARTLAVKNAKLQAQALAEAAGVQLGKILSLSVYSSSPMPVYDVKAYSGLGGAQVPVAAGQISISVDASMSFEIK